MRVKVSRLLRESYRGALCQILHLYKTGFTCFIAVKCPDRCRITVLELLFDDYMPVLVGCRGEIYACIGMTDKDVSWQEDYTLWPFGPCHRVVKKSEPFSVKLWVERTRNFTAQWKYPYDA